MGRAAQDAPAGALAVRARMHVRRAPLGRAGPAAAGRDAARPRAHRLVPGVPLARADAPALPADRRAHDRPLVRPRGADARQARRRRGARWRAAGRRRGARRAVLVRLARPRRRAGDRPAADARGRDPVRQPRPARGARRRFLAAHDLAAGQPPQRRSLADLPRARAPGALRRPRDARGAGPGAPQARRADRARRPLRWDRLARLPGRAEARLREDRQQAHRRDPVLRRTSPARRRARRVRARMRRARRGGGNRAGRRVRGDARPRRRVRPGLLLRSPDRAPDGRRSAARPRLAPRLV